MKSFATLADRTALLSFKLLVALHGVFFLAFVASLLVAAGRL